MMVRFLVQQPAGLQVNYAVWIIRKPGYLEAGTRMTRARNYHNERT